MKRRTAFITGVAAAAITFGSLMVTIGPRHCNSHAKHCGYEQAHHGNHHQATRGNH